MKRILYLGCLPLFFLACPKPIVDNPQDDSICTASFTPDSYSWKAKDGCWADRSAFNAPGLLVYPCAHAGEATATFGPYQFKGTINKRRGVNVVYQTDTVLAGSCSGKSVQQITGKVGEDFHLDYQEIPDEYGCAKPCSASARLTSEHVDVGKAP